MDSLVTDAVLQETLEKKMEIIATRIYGAQGIELSDEARKKLDLYTKQVPSTWHLMNCYLTVAAVVWNGDNSCMHQHQQSYSIVI